MGVELVLFDIGNVIIHADHYITQRFLEWRGVARNRAGLFFDNPDYQRFSKGEITAHEFAEELSKNHLVVNWPDKALQAAHDIHMYGKPSGNDSL